MEACGTHNSPCGGAAGGSRATRACVTRRHVTRFGCFMEQGPADRGDRGWRGVSARRFQPGAGLRAVKRPLFPVEQLIPWRGSFRGCASCGPGRRSRPKRRPPCARHGPRQQCHAAHSRRRRPAAARRVRPGRRGLPAGRLLPQPDRTRRRSDCMAGASVSGWSTSPATISTAFCHERPCKRDASRTKHRMRYPCSSKRGTSRPPI